MAVTGAWGIKNAYTGAAKWGTGNNPIHAVRDNGRGDDILKIKEGFYTGEAGTIPSSIVEDHSYIDGDYFTGIDDPRMVEHHPYNPDGRNYDRSQIPDNYPSWETPSVELAEDTAFRSIPHQSPMESFRYVGSTFLGGNVTGGWKSKQHGEVAYPVTSDPKQYEINTSMVQGPAVGVMTNVRATARGLEARSPIQSRNVGQRVKYYGQSFEMGGGAGTPRMFPYQQSGMPRPFYYRTPGLAPDLGLQYNQIEGRQPLTYVAPDNPNTGPDATGVTGYDYSDGDYSW